MHILFSSPKILLANTLFYIHVSSVVVSRFPACQILIERLAWRVWTEVWRIELVAGR